ncbi:MAG: AMP-binding protein [Treponema sp.]|jgi:fatty-acyl-CoA synthase|nr:AMP-binding protein [Treponema sp.]
MTGLLEITIGEALREQAAKRGDKEFMVFPNRNVRLTFGDMYRKSGELAKGLLACGFKKGGHIGIWANNTPEWAPVFYAAARIGMITVPININCRQQEIGFIIAHADIHALFMIGKFRDTDLVETLGEVIPELKSAGAGKLNSAQFPSLAMVTVFGAIPHQGIHRLEELINRGKALDDEVLQAAEAKVSAADAAVIMYTSGTTGFPKGAILTHRNLINNGYFAIHDKQDAMGAGDVIFNPLPFFYITSLTGAIVEPLIWGFKIVIQESFDILRYLQIIQDEACTWLYAVPAMYAAMISHPKFGEFNLEKVSYGCIGGAMCPPELLRTVMAQFHLKGLYIGYGLTEASPFITDIIVSDPADHRLGTVGVPLAGVEVSIRDPNTHTECPVNTEGEICARGHNTMRGYYKNEAASREAIDQAGWLHTGDLGHLLPGGCLVIDGRIKEMIIRSGEKVYPKEVENLLLAMPGVQDAQVAGMPSDKYGEEVGAFIIRKPGEIISENDVLAFCGGKISRYKIPSYVFFMESYPLSGNGKVQKFKLCEAGLKQIKERGALP